MIVNTEKLLYELNGTLNRTTKNISTSIERLASGFKVNGAKDNPANFSIITEMKTELGALDVARDNIEQGMDMLSYSEDIMANILNNLDRIKQLSIAASNEINDEKSIKAIQQEIDSCIETIEALKVSANYNGLDIFQETYDLDKNYTYKVTDGNIDSQAPTGAGNSLTTFSETFDTPVMTQPTAEEELSNAAGANPCHTKASRVIPEDINTIPSNMVQNTIQNVAQDSSTNTTTNAVLTPRILSDTSVNPNAENQATKTSATQNVENGIALYSVSRYTLVLQAGESQTVTVGGRTYTISNTMEKAGTLEYSYDSDKDLVTFKGVLNSQNPNNSESLNITAATNQADRVRLEGAFGIVNLGNKDDYIESDMSLGNVNAGDGDKTLIITGANVTNNSNNLCYYIGSGNNTVIAEESSRFAKIYTGIGKNNVLIKGHYISTFMRGDDYYETTQEANNNSLSAYGRKVTAISNGQNETLYLQNSTVTVNGTANYIGFTNSTNNNITINGTCKTIRLADGNNTVTMNGKVNKTSTGNGNNIFYINKTTGSIVTGNGDDTFYFADNANATLIDGGGGINKVIKAGTSNFMARNLEGYTDSPIKNYVGYLNLRANETLTVKMSNGYEYTIKNMLGENQRIKIGTDHINTQWGSTASPTFTLLEGKNLEITAKNGQADWIELADNTSDCTIYAGDRNDTIIVGQNSGKSKGHTIYGGDGNDRIYNMTNDTNIYGEAGNDFIELLTNGTANQTSGEGFVVDGGDGEDTISIVTNGHHGLITGGAGDDKIFVGSSSSIWNYCYTDNTNIQGGSGNDKFIIVNGKNNVFGGNGNNIFEINDAIKSGYSINGGTGNDSFTINASDSEGTINGNSGNNTFIINGSNNQDIKTGSGNDTITVSGNNNKIDAQAGEDTITVNGNNNEIDAGLGNDKIYINSSNNSAFITGGDGDDNISVTGTNNSNIHGGAGYDRLYQTSNILNCDGFEDITSTASKASFSIASDTEVKINILGHIYTINSNTAQLINYELQDKMLNMTIENATVNAQNGANNQLNIIGNKNTLNIKDGDDKIIINGNENIITTVSGNKNIQINGDNNTYTGTNDVNTIKINGNSNNITAGDSSDIINIASGEDNTIHALDGDDIITVAGNNNNIYGESGNDTIIFEGYNDSSHVINAGEGDDTLYIKGSGSTGSIDAGAGVDKIIVSGSNNTDLETGAGDDTIINSGVNNVYKNANGNDILYEASSSTITNIKEIHVEGQTGSVTITDPDDIKLIHNDNEYNIKTTVDNTSIGYENNADNLTLNTDKIEISTEQDAYIDLTINGSNNNVKLSDSYDSKLTINGDSNEIKSGNGNYDITSTGNSNKIDCTTGDAYIEVTQDSKDVIINGHDSTVTVLTKGENTTLISCDKLIKQVDSRNIQAGIKGDSSSQIEIDTGFLTGRLTFDVSNSAHTAKSIENVDNLIEEVTQKLTEIGAQYQRLGSALEENETKQINLMSSKSTLQDADVAELTSEYVRNLIIQQSSSILSVTTTNLNMQMVQSLLPKIG